MIEVLSSSKYWVLRKVRANYVYSLWFEKNTSHCYPRMDMMQKNSGEDALFSRLKMKSYQPCFTEDGKLQPKEKRRPDLNHKRVQHIDPHYEPTPERKAQVSFDRGSDKGTIAAFDANNNNNNEEGEKKDEEDDDLLSSLDEIQAECPCVAYVHMATNKLLIPEDHLDNIPLFLDKHFPMMKCQGTVDVFIGVFGVFEGSSVYILLGIGKNRIAEFRGHSINRLNDIIILSINDDNDLSSTFDFHFSYCSICDKGQKKPGKAKLKGHAAFFSALSGSSQRRKKLEIKILTDVLKLFNELSCFYYCPTYDITTSLQRQQSNLYISHKEPWERADDRFFWNKALLQCFFSTNNIKSWIVPIIQGFVSQASLAYLNRDNTKRHMYIILISRRSRYRAGMRYRTRGTDANGRVANYVETEQILYIPEHNVITSFVVVRGSVPLFWKQPGKDYRPIVLMQKTLVENTSAFENHFDREIDLYGDVAVLNLVDQVGKSEPRLFYDFLYHVLRYNSQHLHFVGFDFHAECKGLRFDKAIMVVDYLRSKLEYWGFFWLSGNRIKKIQRGVCRVNCVDCLDRTNVMQMTLAKFLLLFTFKKLGVVRDNAHFPEIYRRTFQRVWADNGDAISNMYAGTGALKADYTRTGRRKMQGVMQDGMKSVNRYVNKLFRDAAKNAAINALTMAHLLTFERVTTDDKRFNGKESDANSVLSGREQDPIDWNQKMSVFHKVIGNAQKLLASVDEKAKTYQLCDPSDKQYYVVMADRARNENDKCDISVFFLRTKKKDDDNPSHLDVDSNSDLTASSDTYSTTTTYSDINDTESKVVPMNNNQNNFFWNLNNSAKSHKKQKGNIIGITLDVIDPNIIVLISKSHILVATISMRKTKKCKQHICEPEFISLESITELNIIYSPEVNFYSCYSLYISYGPKKSFHLECANYRPFLFENTVFMFYTDTDVKDYITSLVCAIYNSVFNLTGKGITITTGNQRIDRTYSFIHSQQLLLTKGLQNEIISEPDQSRGQGSNVFDDVLSRSRLSIELTKLGNKFSQLKESISNRLGGNANQDDAASDRPNASVADNDPDHSAADDEDNDDDDDKKEGVKKTCPLPYLQNIKQNLSKTRTRVTIVTEGKSQNIGAFAIYDKLSFYESKFDLRIKSSICFECVVTLCQEKHLERIEVLLKNSLNDIGSIVEVKNENDLKLLLEYDEEIFPGCTDYRREYISIFSKLHCVKVFIIIKKDKSIGGYAMGIVDNKFSIRMTPVYGNSAKEQTCLMLMGMKEIIKLNPIDGRCFFTYFQNNQQCLKILQSEIGDDFKVNLKMQQIYNNRIPKMESNPFVFSVSSLDTMNF
ncbi:hypothetical protein SNEBB_003487 [Seison nebaliae]|nr:hypothetical protein SNEBB_003487 [Seison nebaliae]